MKKYIALEPLYSRTEKKHFKTGEVIKLDYSTAVLLLKAGAIKVAIKKDETK